MSSEMISLYIWLCQCIIYVMKRFWKRGHWYIWQFWGQEDENIGSWGWYLLILSWQRNHKSDEKNTFLDPSQRTLWSIGNQRPNEGIHVFNSSQDMVWRLDMGVLYVSYLNFVVKNDSFYPIFCFPLKFFLLKISSKPL